MPPITASFARIPRFLWHPTCTPLMNASAAWRILMNRRIRLLRLVLSGALLSDILLAGAMLFAQQQPSQQQEPPQQQQQQPPQQQQAPDQAQPDTQAQSDHVFVGTIVKSGDKFMLQDSAG